MEVQTKSTGEAETRMDCRGLRLTETQAHPYPVFDNCNKRRSRLKPTVATCFPESRHILQAGYHIWWSMQTF